MLISFRRASLKMSGSTAIRSKRRKTCRLPFFRKVNAKGDTIIVSQSGRNVSTPLKIGPSSPRRFCDCQRTECISHLVAPLDISVQTCRVASLSLALSKSGALKCIPLFPDLRKKRKPRRKKSQAREIYIYELFSNET